MFFMAVLVIPFIPVLLHGNGIFAQPNKNRDDLGKCMARSRPVIL